MKSHEIHLEFMKAAIAGLLPQVNYNKEAVIEICLAFADASLIAYQERWPNLDTEK